MKEIIKIKVFKPFVVIVLVAVLIISSCSPKATHLTQNLENSGVPGQSLTPSPVVATQKPGEVMAPVLPPTSVNEPTSNSIEPLTTQAPSVTLPPIQPPTSPVIILTSTAISKSTTPQAATSTPAPTQTRTSTPTQTRTPTRTATLTPSLTLQIGWEGEWTAFLAQPDGTYRSGTLIVTISGDSVIGVFDNAGVTMNLEGSLQPDGIIVSGDYTLPAASGRFKWAIQENSYFIGNINNGWAFCAAREGSPQPYPCGYFDPF